MALVALPLLALFAVVPDGVGRGARVTALDGELLLGGCSLAQVVGVSAESVEYPVGAISVSSPIA